ncbi:MAG: choice-of-anchor L domain-containing protein [Flavisolibacter sp.]
MVFIKRLFLVLLVFSFSLNGKAQLNIIPQTNALQLAQKLVGYGVTIKNVSLTGSSLSSGFFYNQGGTQLGIDSGIVLSTGRVVTSANFLGLNGRQNLTASSQMNTPGDPQLASLVYPRETNDAVVLEFDFIPVGDSVKFRYVFSSEEYPTFTCSNFNDVFAFFINGPGISGTKNIALVPGTNIPVAINSINSGNPGTGYDGATCNSMGPGSPFTQFYIDNTSNPYFTHNGHTVVLTAAAAVQPCQSYHLKIAIADVQDKSYDSGVFLQAESLKSDPLVIIPYTPFDNNQPYLAEGCKPGGIKILRSRKLPYPQPVNLSFGGTAINGTDVQLIPSVVTIPADDSLVMVPINSIVDHVQEGNETLKIYVSNGCIFSNLIFDSIEIQLRDYDTLALSPWERASICSQSGLQVIANPGFTSYQWAPASSMDHSDIFNPVVSPASGTTYICTATVGDCQAMDSIRVDVKNMDLVSLKNINCRNGNSGEIKVGGGSEWKGPVSFSINDGVYSPDSVFKNLEAGNYLIKMQDVTGCIDSMQVKLIQAFPDLTITDSISSASCSGINGKLSISATGGSAPYSYAVDGINFSTANLFNVNTGDHNISVRDNNGCVSSRAVMVGMDPPLAFTTSTSAGSCSGTPDGMIYIHASGGSGQYLYSANGSNFQTDDSLLVNAGNVNVTVKDLKGCSSTQSIFVPLNQSVFVHAFNDTTICEGNKVQLHLNTDAQQFSWSPASTLSASSEENPIAAPHITTTYYVIATKGICSASDSITVHVLQAPIPDAGADSVICYGKSIQLHGSGGSSYLWTSSSQINSPSDPAPTVRPLQSSVYYLLVKDDHQCTSLIADSIKITVVPGVQVFAVRDTSIARGQLFLLNGLDFSSNTGNIYQWSPAYGLDHPNSLKAVATTDHDITYTLTITTPEGCEGKDEIVIKVFANSDIYVPTGFTPNGDGKNDVLKAIPVGMKQLDYFRVFNRWGQLIFSTKSEGMGWDGMMLGKQQPTGTYTWVAEGIDYSGTRIVRRGFATLIR